MMKHRSKNRIILWIVVAVSIIAAFGVALHLIENVLGDSSDSYDYEDENRILTIGDTEYEITHNIDSYLLIGTDDSGNVEAEGTRDYRGQMADFLMLFVMDRTNNTHGFLQIDRNTMVNVPEIDIDGDEVGEIFEQICTAHWYGTDPAQGCENTVAAVETLLGDMKIDGYYSIHMSDVGILNHAVDGVEVTLDEDFSASDRAMTKGTTLTLTDEQAQIYVRGRMTVGDGKNESRMKRQTTYMSQFKAKAKERIEEDASFANDLFAALEDDAVTNLPGSSVSVMANQLYKGEDLGFIQIAGETKMGTTLGDGEEHEEFYADERSIAEAMVKLCGIDEEHIHKAVEE